MKQTSLIVPTLLVLILLAAAVMVLNFVTPGVLAPQGGVAGMTVEEGLAELEKLQTSFNAALENDGPLETILERSESLANDVPQVAEMAGVHTLLGQIYIQQLKFDLALQAIGQSLALDEAQPQVHNMAGTVAYQIKDYETAEVHYAAAVRLEPDKPSHTLFLAQVYIDLQKYQEAKHLLLDLLQRDSSQHKAYAQLADLYARQNKLEMALGQIQKAIESTPVGEIDQQAVYRRTKAKLLLRKGEADAALMTLQSLSAAERKQVAVIEEFAACYMMLGKPGKAAEVYEKYLLDDPMNVELLAGAAAYRVKAGEMEMARVHIEALKAINPGHPQVEVLEGKLK